MGGVDPGDRSGDFVGEAQLGLDLWLTDDLRLFAHGRARCDGEMPGAPWSVSPRDISSSSLRSRRPRLYTDGRRLTLEARFAF
ncbi:MAG: hypothetical protein LJF30_12620 [Acidobacteria bacterium]|nr:hypothetical protein [Acidobacteriota bacterium]